MAFTAGLRPTIAARIDASAATASFGKQNGRLCGRHVGNILCCGGTVSIARSRPFAGLSAMRSERNPEHSGAVEKPHCNA
ncbi:hypothetical protein [Bradyrhizobium mercantei]|uniref:hypothetical protein n=1 Tax=Bradyrhizobium mercantei TaxID=1904807 RepID=UPI00117741E3|nr:hypothetical protein [Bradyrhizobium mercantei]